MRSEHSIEHEIDVARTDLEDNLGELKASVKELTTIALIAYNRRA